MSDGVEYVSAFNDTADDNLEEPTIDTDAIFTTKQAAEYLRLSQQTLETWRHKGIGPPYYKIGNRSIRYSRNDLWRYVTRNKKNSTIDS